MLSLLTCTPALLVPTGPLLRPASHVAPLFQPASRVAPVFRMSEDENSEQLSVLDTTPKFDRRTGTAGAAYTVGR